MTNMNANQRAHEFLREGPTGRKAQHGAGEHMFIADFLHQANVFLNDLSKRAQRLRAIVDPEETPFMSRYEERSVLTELAKQAAAPGGRWGRGGRAA